MPPPERSRPDNPAPAGGRHDEAVHPLGRWFALAASVAVALILWPTLQHRPAADHFEFLRQVILPGALLVLVLLVAVRHERRWKRQTRVLARLAGDVRRRVAAVEELDVLVTKLPPDLASIGQELATLAGENRQQGLSMRRLEAEISHRVANRTDTLERRLSVMRTKAQRDALTGLSNRGCFDEVYPDLVEQARRAGSDLSVVMIDVDYFKQLNDTLGHAKGDEMLRSLGQLIRGAIRDRDEAFRYGGDEFVLLLGNTPPAAARATCERLGRLVEDLSVRTFRVERPPRLSYGLASLSDAPAADPADLLKSADADCYRYKRARKAARAA